MQASSTGAPLVGAAGEPSGSPPGAKAHADLALALEGRPVTRLIVETAVAGQAGAAGGSGAGSGTDDGAHEHLANVLAGIVAHRPELAVSAAPGGRFEVHHVWADKRAALAALCGRLGVPASAVVACGDGAVDAGMIDWAGVGVAVAEGHRAALAVADVVVARSELAELLEGSRRGRRPVIAQGVTAAPSWAAETSRRTVASRRPRCFVCAILGTVQR